MKYKILHTDQNKNAAFLSLSNPRALSLLKNLTVMKRIFLSIFLFFSLPSFSLIGSNLSAKKRNYTNLQSSKLGQAIINDNIRGYRIELALQLERPSLEFVQFINSRMLFEGAYETLFESMARNHLKKAQPYQETLWSQEMRNLSRFLIPPLHKKNKQGQTPLELAIIQKNEPAQNLLNKYRKINPAYELYDNSADEQIKKQLPRYEGNIFQKASPSQTYLEDRPLVKALINQDLEGFNESLFSLAQEPAKDTYTLFHLRTRTGETLLHLLARAEHHQGEFAEGLENLINRIAPANFKKDFIEKNSNFFSQVFSFGFMGLGGVPALYFLSNQMYLESLVAGSALLFGGYLCHNIFKNSKQANTLKNQ